jgi:hypothetical protein
LRLFSIAWCTFKERRTREESQVLAFDSWRNAKSISSQVWPFLVSRDNDLLSLMNDAAFRSQFPFLTILDPKAFLSHVRAEIAKGLGYE